MIGICHRQYILDKIENRLSYQERFNIDWSKSKWEYSGYIITGVNIKFENGEIKSFPF